jgi:hypothetical protein
LLFSLFARTNSPSGKPALGRLKLTSNWMDNEMDYC